MQIRYLWSQGCNQYQWRAKKWLTSKFEVRCPVEKKETFLNKRSEELVRNSPPIKRKKRKSKKALFKSQPEIFLLFRKEKNRDCFLGCFGEIGTFRTKPVFVVPKKIFQVLFKLWRMNLFVILWFSKSMVRYYLTWAVAVAAQWLDCQPRF